MTSEGIQPTITRMKVIDIANLKRKETPVYYRKEFKGDAIIEIMQEMFNTPVEFVVEHKPVGGIDIRVTLTEDIDYPIIPIVSSIKTHIKQMHERGSLP